MSDKYFAKKINLHVNEELVAILHHHPITYAKQIVVTALLILGSFFFMFLLFSLGELGVALFCALLLTGIIYGCREFYIWYANVCVVTSERLVDIDQGGIFHKIVSDIDFGKIVDISYSVKGIRQTIFNIGSIKVQASGATLLLQNIKEPGKVNQLLVDLIRKQTGKQMEVKRVVTVGSKAKEKIMENFANQAELEQYEEYNLQELIEDYKETFGELSLKKLLVEELEAEESSSPDAKEEQEEVIIEKTPEKEVEGNFKQKRL